MAILTVDNLSHTYPPDRRALDSVSLSIDPGEIFALLGPNGSGKSTLFRLLATLVDPQSGSISFSIANRQSQIETLSLPADRDGIRRHIAVVFQSPSLDKQLTAEENLRHHGHLYGLRGHSLSTRIAELLTRFDLIDRKSDFVSTFSGGMRRRVELAKGLLTRPRLFIMDEPSTGLDPSARLDLWDALKSARDDDGVTVLLTTHLMDEADKCDRIAIMSEGKLLATASPTQLKDSVGGDVLTLTSPDPGKLASALADRFQIQTTPLPDGTIRLERPAAHQFIPQLIESLPTLITACSIAKPTLEDVFIHLTGHRLDHPSPA